jgi:alpha-D-xyloside xylohydrolase
LKETGNPEFQHQENMMNYRGQEVVLSQSNVNAISPVLVSTQNYGIFWDNYSLTKFNNQNQSIMQLWSEMGDCIEFYFTAGNNADQVIANYRQLTRVEPLLPRWAFGYWQSKERYKTQQETKNIAQRYRKERIPIDVIVQDWEWWEPGKWS